MNMYIYKLVKNKHYHQSIQLQQSYKINMVE